MIVITGASGRLGMAVRSMLKQQGVPHKGLGRRGSTEIVQVDYSNPESLEAALQGASEIWHLAGGVRGAGTDTPDVINHQLSKVIVEAAQKAAPKSKLLMVSSTAVYGDRSNLWVDENMPPNPNTRYGQSKLDSENVFQTSGMEVQIVRMGTIYGSKVPFMAAEHLQSNDLWLPGEGRCYIPTIHIDDAANGIIHIAKTLDAGEIVHLADTDPMMLSEFYGLVCSRIGTSFRARFWSTWVPSYIQHHLARNSERLQSKLNRRPRWTPDSLKLYTSSVRVQTTKLTNTLCFSHKYPSAIEGIEASIPT